MRSPLDLAAITAALKHTLANALADPLLTEAVGSEVTISALPPDRVASDGEERARINLFLYQMTPNTGLRASRAFHFDLYYIVSAYGSRDLVIETLLGAANSAFHSQTILSRSQLQSIFTALEPSPATRAGGDLSIALQITPQFLPLEEASKLWTAFQTRYRPSLFYKVVALGEGA